MSSNNKDGPSSTFEFTKRKRWADLLITELADTIIIVLSTDCKILYCGTSVHELLGWRDADLLNRDFGDLISPDDVDAFRTTFQAGSEFMVYTKLKTRDPMYPPSLLFEIKAHPQMSFIIAMARPYPSRNAAMLNTFLDLKVENERLQRRLRELTGNAPGALNVSPVVSNRYPPNPGPLPLYTSTSLSVGGYDNDRVRTPVRSSFDGGGGGVNLGPPTSLYSTNTLADHLEEEDGSKKKKAKKTHSSDQYVCVTCGRTDSPEWRKGPLGPKTLCNACGLRWAKSVRKSDETSHAAAEGGEITLS
ncbi:hypothetical protein CPB85DRAFT_1439155 [Mucidula mucida]|nr:hypothetical protein CPB85DRAFT_1439155 [Mucidula mucida]